MSQALQLWAIKAALLSHIAMGMLWLPPLHTSAPALGMGCRGFPPLCESGLELGFTHQLHSGAPVPNSFQLAGGVKGFRHFVCPGGTTQDVSAADVCSCALLTVSQILMLLCLREEILERPWHRPVCVCLMRADEILTKCQPSWPYNHTPKSSRGCELPGTKLWVKASSVTACGLGIYMQHGRCGVFPKTCHKHNGIPEGCFAWPGML